MISIDLTDEQCEYLMRVLLNNYGSVHEDYAKYTSYNEPSDYLVGLLVSKNRKLRDSYNKIKNLKFKMKDMKDSLNQKLFCGAGFLSTLMINDLHKRLEYAVGMLSGMQQNGGMGTEFDKDFNKEANQALINFIKDMMFAFDVSSEDLK